MLAFEAYGHGGPLVVLVHGWPLDRSIWSEVAPEVAAAGFRVIALDLPGFGDSPPVDFSNATVEAYAAELARTIAAFPAKRAAVAGHSFGGYVALALAGEHAKTLTGLGLVSSRTTADTDVARKGRQESADRVRKEGTRALLPGLVGNLLGPEATGSMRARATEIVARSRPDGVVAALAAMAARPDRTGTLDRFAGPRLVIHGSMDALIPVAEAAQPQGLGVRRVLLPTTGHMPMWEAPEATAAALIAWARSIRA